MANRPMSVPKPKPFKFLHGTWPPSPKAVPVPPPSRIKPAENQRDYAKVRPLMGES